MRIIQDPIYKVPQHIIDAADTVALYAKEHGWQHWELRGIADRALVSALRVTAGNYERTLNKIRELL